MIGKKILNYEITALIGEGGMGNVYLAKHTKLDRVVAIKSILPELVNNDEIKKRFLNEATSMSKLQHPNIVAMYDYHSDDEGLYLIMEYVEGKELDDYVRNLGKPLDEELSMVFMKQILSAFSHAHEKGIVHRDIKPGNIIISNSGEIKILDFGIAKIVGEEAHQLTKTGTQVGTVYYMSPEQVLGKKITHLSDIYSLGVTMYELVTSINPYKGITTEYEIYDKIVKHDLPDPRDSNSKLSKHISEVLAKASSKDPKERYQTCQEFAMALQSSEKNNISISSKVEDSSNSKIVVQNKPKGNKSTVIILSALLGIVVVVFVLFQFQSSSSDDKDDSDESNVEQIEEREIVNPYFIQSFSDYVFPDKKISKEEFKNEWARKYSYGSNYSPVKYPNLNLEFWGWTIDGNSIALTKRSSDCYDGFCDYFTKHFVFDLSEDNIKEQYQYNTGNDGYGTLDDINEITETAYYKMIDICKENKVDLYVNHSESSRFYNSKEVDWEGEYFMNIERDTLFMNTTNQYGDPVRRRVSKIEGYDEYTHEILGYFKSPYHKRIAIIIKVSNMTASGINESYEIYGALLRNSDYRRYDQ